MRDRSLPLQDVVGTTGCDRAGVAPLTNSAGPSVRYRALDGYRFVAAALVALHHYNLAFGLDLERWFTAIPQLGAMVDFFFVLSGFVIATAYADRIGNWQGYRDFLRARLARLYPLHLATATMSMMLIPAALIFHVTQNHPEATSMAGLPANLLLLHAWGVLDHLSFNGPSWSISAEWAAYLLCPILFVAARRLRLPSAIAATLAFVVVLATWRHVTGQSPWWGASYDFGALKALPLFFAGVLIAFRIGQIPARIAPPWWAVHLVFLAALVGLDINAPREIVTLLFVALVLGAALAERAKRPTLMASSTMSVLGDASYSLYMLHFLMAVPIALLVRKMGFSGTPLAGVAAMLTFAFVLAVSIVTYRRFEVPLRRILGPGGRGQDAERLRAPATNLPLLGSQP